MPLTTMYILLLGLVTVEYAIADPAEFGQAVAKGFMPAAILQKPSSPVPANPVFRGLPEGPSLIDTVFSSEKNQPGQAAPVSSVSSPLFQPEPKGLGGKHQKEQRRKFGSQDSHNVYFNAGSWIPLGFVVSTSLAISYGLIVILKCIWYGRETPKSRKNTAQLAAMGLAAGSGGHSGNLAAIAAAAPPRTPDARMQAQNLSPPPPELDNYSPLSSKKNALSSIRRSAAAAIGRALDAGVELLEIDFPPLLETKGQFEDFSNEEVLDSNRDFAMQLALERELTSAAPEAALWLVFGDAKEAELAQQAWPGKRYNAATTTSIDAAVRVSGGKPFEPLGFWMVKSQAEAAAAKAKDAPAPMLQLAVQPGEYGPMDDWLNLELLKREGTPLICLNGALEKTTNGYYSDFLNPKLASCGKRFYSRFEPVYYCKKLDGGWLFRVYPQAWQVHRQTKQGLVLVETYEERPTFLECNKRLRLP